MRSAIPAANWLCIEGVIGAGKTTTAELIAERHGVAVIQEIFDQHPLLAAYYRDRQRFALETELVFTALRAHAAKIAVLGSPVVSDFSPAKTSVFAGLVLAEDDQAALAAVDERLWAGQVWPETAVFLDVPADRCLERLRWRNRPFEREVQVRDLDALRERYLQELDSLGQEVIRISLDGTESADAVGDAVIAAAGPRWLRTTG
jgi:deoxyadenosine/deoxycytidine kinase